MTWSNQGVPLGSSYGPCMGGQPVQTHIPQVQMNTKLESTWSSPSCMPNNIDRERERDRLSQAARPYPPSAYGADPYPYPPAHPSPPRMHRTQATLPSGQQYHRQQLVTAPQITQPAEQQQQPLISSFGPGRSPSPSGMINPNRRPGDWDCPACVAHNFSSRSECFKCGMMKPGGVTRRPGDWWCGKCNGHNYAYRVDCFKCGADKAEGNSEPRANGTLPYGGRRAGDWNCPNCNAHCFASRMECFKCGEPKPVDLSTDV